MKTQTIARNARLTLLAISLKKAERNVLIGLLDSNIDHGIYFNAPIMSLAKQGLVKVGKYVLLTPKGRKVAHLCGDLKP